MIRDELMDAPNWKEIVSSLCGIEFVCVFMISKGINVLPSIFNLTHNSFDDDTFPTDTTYLFLVVT